MLRIIPQQFNFEHPNIINAKGETIEHGITISIGIDAMKANKEKIKQELESIFAEVLEYFD